MRASPQRAGNGYITSYRLAIGSAAARRCGFVLEDGERVELVVEEMPEEKAVVIRVANFDKMYLKNKD